VSTGPATSASIEPVVVETRRELCPVCDGVGHIVSENRKHERDSSSDLFKAFVALRDALSVAMIDLEELRQDNGRLRLENVRLREAVAKAARKIELGMKGASHAPTN
jgi:hypothetical protein